MEIEKKGVVFIAYDCENKAVWNAIKLHVEFVQESHEEISFIADERYIEIVKKDYPNYPVHAYSSRLNLAIKLIQLDAKYIFSPVMFTTLLAFPSKLFDKKNVIYWVQGAVPEESYLRHQSKLRYHLLSAIEHIALRISNSNIFVSTEMKKELEKKMKRRLENSIIVPCISEFTYDGSKKERDSFVYIGGMSAWQRVDKMIEMFNQIIKERPHAKLYIATLEQEQARVLIDKHLDSKYKENITLLSINNREEIPHFLSTKEYGFLIREDIIVNNVSSPIKLAEYLSCGINVIISDAVKSYAPIIANEGAGISISSNDNIVEKLNAFEHNSSKSLLVYKNYFSKEVHISNYLKLLNKEL